MAGKRLVFVGENVLLADFLEQAGIAHHIQHLLGLLAAGRSVTLTGETGRLLDGVKERVPRWRFERRKAIPCLPD